MFVSSGQAGFRALVLVVISVSLLFFGNKSNVEMTVRQTISYVFLPVHWSSAILVIAKDNLSAYLMQQENLAKKYQEQHRRILQLEADVMELNSLRYNYRRLSEVVKLRGNMIAHGSFQIVGVINIIDRPGLKRFYINKGSSDGLGVGQAVLDDKAIVGQIIRVQPNYAEVLVVTDSEHALSVRDKRTGNIFVAEGVGTDNLLKIVTNVQNHGVKVGDEIVTSGLGQIFPSQYPVGIVESIEEHLEKNEIYILAKPLASLNKVDLVGVYVGDSKKPVFNMDTH